MMCESKTNPGFLRVFLGPADQLLLFEFDGGNLDSVRWDLFKSWNFLGKAIIDFIHMAFPVYHFFYCSGLILRLFGKKTSLVSGVEILALTVGEKDIYYQSYFADKSNCLVISFLPLRKLFSSSPSVYDSLTIRQVMIEMIVSYPLFTAFTAIVSSKKFRALSSFKARLIFFAMVCSETAKCGPLRQRLLSNALETMFSKHRQIKMVVLPLEGRTWEKRVVKSARSMGVKTVGFCHGAINPDFEGILGTGMHSFHTPTFTICVGDFFRTLLIDSGWTAESVGVCSYLRKIEPLKCQDNAPQKIVVFLVGNLAKARIAIDYFASLERSVVNVEFCLQSRAPTFTSLTQYLRKKGGVVWAGDSGSRDLIFSQSMSLLIEKRMIGFKAYAILTEYDHEFRRRPFVGSDLYKNSLDITSAGYVSSEELYSDWSSINESTRAPWYFKADKNRFRDFSNNLNKVFNSKCDSV